MAATSLREPVQERALKTRAGLLEAAEREFSERGYAQTTAKSIAGRAGVATGSFYQYFSDKDAALRELARARAAELARRVAAVELARAERDELELERAARAAISRMVGEVLEYHRRDRGLHAVLTERRLADPELAAIADESERAFLLLIEGRLAEWGYQGDRKATAFVIFGMIEGAIHSHVLGTRTLSDRRFVEALSGAVVTLVRAGIAA